MIMFNFLLNAVSKEFQVSRLINNKSHTVGETLFVSCYFFIKLIKIKV